MPEVVPVISKKGEVCSVCHAKARRHLGSLLSTISHAPMCAQVRELQQDVAQLIKAAQLQRTVVAKQHTLIGKLKESLTELIQGVGRFEPLFASLNNRVADLEESGRRDPHA